MNKESKIYIAGHRGMVGSAILRRLESDGYENLIFKTRDQLDLLCQQDVLSFFSTERPDVVFLAAARVGGIMANIHNQAAFLYENLQIQNNVIHAAREYGTTRFVFLGSSCIYPRECLQPMKEDVLLQGALEPTNEGYALAKIAGVRLLQYMHDPQQFSTLSVIPCNLYGHNDHFDLQKGHVLASLVKRFVDAVSDNRQSLTLWGSGGAYRELMHVDDMVDALLHVMNHDQTGYINLGTGEDITIKQLAELIAKKVGYEGAILWDRSRPDGMPRKCLDVSRIQSQGWFPKISLEMGVEQMIRDYKKLERGVSE